jgi:F-type H+-transporting ATPase subunit b
MSGLKRLAKVPEFWLFLIGVVFAAVGSFVSESANFWILIAFITFMAAFGRKAWGAIKTTLDGRADKIRQELEEAQHLKEEAQSVLADYERKKTAAEEEARQMVEHAKAEAERQAEDAKKALEHSMKRREELAMQRIAQAESEALREVRETAARLAVQATVQLIRENLDKGRADQMIEDSIKEVREKLH